MGHFEKSESGLLSGTINRSVIYTASIYICSFLRSLQWAMQLLPGRLVMILMMCPPPGVSGGVVI